MAENIIPKNETEQPVELSIADTPTTYAELVEEDVFLGPVLFEAIIEGLEEQFNDYINIVDTTDYVDTFYVQMAESRAVVAKVDEEHPEEKTEVLDRLYQKFIDTMRDLFKTKLTISIAMLESETISKHNDDLEFILRRMYEYFILGARKNFMTVITKDVLGTISPDITDGEWFQAVQEKMDDYSPLLKTVTPDAFLQYRGDLEIYELFGLGMVAGNFLRKYSPRFYRNMDFQVEVINHITMVYQFKEDMMIKDNPIPEKEVEIDGGPTDPEGEY